MLILLKLLKKPWWWVLLLCVPGVNALVLAIINVNVHFAFGKRKFQDVILAVVAPHYVFGAAAFQEKSKWVGPLVWKNKKEKGMIREWGDALLFAVVAAGIIRGFFFEAFTIPTGSMEKDLLIGDYLFVNKVAYGSKLPQTPVAVPFFHNNIPGTYIPCYLEWFKMDYHRLPGYQDVERNEIVVFNYPAGDTALLGNMNGSELQGHNYHQYLKDEALFLAGGDRNKLASDYNLYLNQARVNLIEKNKISHMNLKTAGWIERRTDKKENYIKRCVGIPGDSLQIIDGRLIVNGEDAYLDTNAQYNYRLRPNKTTVIRDNFKNKYKEKYDINPTDWRSSDRYGRSYNGDFVVSIAQKHIEEIRASKQFDSIWIPWKKSGYYVEDEMESRAQYLNIFPNHKLTEHWTEDNMGPWYLPKAGDEIELNEFNIAFYRRAIESYEKNKVSIESDGIYINDEIAKTYKFKMNYYWMMGDNRHNSLDCRMWGYVPEDHVVGKAAIIWFSKDNEPNHERIRWERIFQLAH